MIVVRTVAALRERLADVRTRPRTIGFIPTMGALHAGHLALVKRACSECDVIVASIFVNPTQFNNPDDLVHYPRPEAVDLAQLKAADVDIVLVPSVAEMYPGGFATSIEVGGVALPLEGAARGPHHFRGVATVVAKLFNIVEPHVAYFGQKDAQQVQVVRQLVRDLDFPIEIVACDTVREPDGLALSSRNALLNAEARAQAAGLSAALFRMRALAAGGERHSAALIDAGYATLELHDIGRDAVDYLAVVHPETMLPVDHVEGEAVVVVAANVGGVRLIDNVVVTAHTRSAPGETALS